MARSKGKVIGISFFGKPKKKTTGINIHREHVSKSGDNAWFTSRWHANPTTKSVKRARRAMRKLK